MKVHLLSSDHESAQENEWNVPFDPSLKEVTVSLSGPAPQIEMKDPFGRSFDVCVQSRIRYTLHTTFRPLFDLPVILECFHVYTRSDSVLFELYTQAAMLEKLMD